MGILLISLAAGVVLGVVSSFAVGWLGAILPGLAGVVAAYFFLGRWVNRQLEAGMARVQVEMQKGPNHIPQAIELLKALRDRFGRLQFFAGSSLDGQIGTILFMQQKYKEARPYLERAFVRLWQAKVMLAVLDYKKKDLAAVDKNLEHTAKYSGKQGLLWSAWAWMHFKSGNRDRAIDLLNRGVEQLKDADPALTANLLSLKNGNKMKMKAYGDAWYQLGLETHPMLKKAQRGNVRFARR